MVAANDADARLEARRGAGHAYKQRESHTPSMASSYSRADELEIPMLSRRRGREETRNCPTVACALLLCPAAAA